MLEAGSERSAAKLALICATTEGDATADAGSSAPPDGTMEKLSVSCALTAPQPLEPAGGAIPATHAVQAVAPASEYEPREHGWHDVEPGSGVKKPAAQTAHVAEELAPTAAEALPAAQGVQVVAPALLA